METETLICRGKGNILIPFSIVFIFSGLLIIIFGLYLTIESLSLEANNMSFLLLGILTLFISLFVIYSGVDSINKIRKNNSIFDECVGYNSKTNKLIVTTLKNEKIIINPAKFKNIKRNLFTDFVVQFYYLDDEQKIKVEKLGFTGNIKTGLNRLQELTIKNKA